MGLLASGQAMLADVMTGEGQAITIKRDSSSLATVAAPDDPMEVEVNQDGLVIVSSNRRFAMNVADYGMFGLPVKGDTITIGALVYLVCPSPSSSRCYEWQDNRHSRMSIHTKLIQGAG